MSRSAKLMVEFFGLATGSDERREAANRSRVVRGRSSVNSGLRGPSGSLDLARCHRDSVVVRWGMCRGRFARRAECFVGPRAGAVGSPGLAAGQDRRSVVKQRRRAAYLAGPSRDTQRSWVLRPAARAAHRARPIFTGASGPRETGGRQSARRSLQRRTAVLTDVLRFPSDLKRP